MKTPVPLLLILALASACEKYESPTSPMRVAANAVADELFIVAPTTIILQPGQIDSVTIGTREPLPHGSAFEVRPYGIVELTGEPIGAGGTMTTFHVKALRPGSAVLYALVNEPGQTHVERAIADVQVAFDPRFTFEPERIVLRPGETTQIRVRAQFSYPLGVTFGCAILDCGVAEISGSIPQGGREGLITITALRPGTARIVATVWNFGRAPGQAISGEVIVDPPQSRRRSVRH